MRLVKSIAKHLTTDSYCERELKNLDYGKPVDSAHHIRDYGTMNNALHRLIDHGIVKRFRMRNKRTGRFNYYYAMAVEGTDLTAYIEKKQKQFDHCVLKYRKKQAEHLAKHEPVDAIRSMASLPSDPLAKVYAMTTDERIKAFIEKARPDLKPVVEQYPNVYKFADETKVGDAIFSITSYFNGTPLCLGWALAPNGLIGKCLAVDPSYKANIIDEYGHDVIYFTKK